ncbi:AraC family transcriptional regulator [Trinickia dabaoshanensis]|uniref:AraC family transcriptional regulator n=2 Tax=Trinickia dabaoshanensis TaxID=564714 RepID=A0A2N7VHT7_9BURK|nr:AraC family transcriptional regulator [Trinickia dabaoshanensis]PMS16708.1 AraC family transcriptional regulator [Trinickia dabaoshanensis]
MRRTEGLDQARAFIEAHFAEPLTLEQMAAPAALSISRFATAFRERFGSSPYRYLCGLRIERAQSLLLAGVPSVAVATEVGFFDQSHFGRHFKRMCGMTPTLFVAVTKAGGCPDGAKPAKALGRRRVSRRPETHADGSSGPGV